MATITLIHLDPSKREENLFAETISYEDVTVDVHSLATFAEVEAIKAEQTTTSKS